MRGKRFLDAYISNEKASSSIASSANRGGSLKNGNNDLSLSENRSGGSLFSFMAGNRKSNGSITSQQPTPLTNIKTANQNKSLNVDQQQQRQKISFVQDPNFLILIYSDDDNNKSLFFFNSYFYFYFFKK
jgi:hypothetical protein